MKAPALGVLLQPAAQPRPLAKQRLVGDLDRVLVDGDETALGQRREGARGVLVALDLQLGERDPPADRCRLLGVGEPQQDGSRPLALRLAQAPVGAFGEARHGAADAAARRIAGLAQGPSASLLPELEQGGGQQWQTAGLVGNIVDQLRGQPGLDPQARPAGRELDRPAQLLARHRPDEHLVGADLGGKRPVLGAAAVEVGADREHDDDTLLGIVGEADERLCEGRPLAFVATGGEQLLELIDGEHQALVRFERVQRRSELVVTVALACRGRDARHDAAQLRERMLARSDQHLSPAPRAWQHAVRQRRQQPGAQHRGLATARRPEHGQQGRADKPRDKTGDEVLAAEEVLGLSGGEGRQPTERADLGRRRINRLGGQVAVGALASRLQVHDVFRQLRLCGAQLASLARRTGDLRLQPLGCMRLGPRARRPVRAKRYPVALGHQRLDRHRDPVRGRVERGDLGDRVGPEPIQGEAMWRRGRSACQGRWPALVLGKDEDEQRRLAPFRGQRPCGLVHGGRSLVGVVEDEERRGLALARGADGLKGRLGRPRARGVEDARAGPVKPGRELGGEPGLADPGGARDERDPRSARLGLGPALAQPGQLALAPGEQRRAALELAWQLRRWRRRVERGVLGEDLLLQAAQLGPGLDPDLLAQRPVGPAVGLERIGAAPGAVEGEHQLGVKALVERMLCKQRLQAADHLAVAPGGELGVDGQLEHAQMKLLEPADLGSGKRLCSDVGERRSAPELERAPRRAVGDPALGVVSRILDQLLEAQRVHRLLRQLELVAAAVGDDARPRVVEGQCLTQARDVELDVLGGARRRAFGVEAIDQLLGAHRPVGAQREHREHRSLFASSEW